MSVCVCVWLSVWGSSAGRRNEREMVNGKWKHRSYNVVFVQTHIIRHGKTWCVCVFVCGFELHSRFRIDILLCNAKAKGHEWPKAEHGCHIEAPVSMLFQPELCLPQNYVLSWNANVEFFGWSLILIRMMGKGTMRTSDGAISFCGIAGREFNYMPF